jgi:hypothetical protein
MKQSVLVFISAVLLCQFSLAQDAGVSLSSFDWLTGTWENTRVKPNESASESWMRDGGQFVGTGVTMHGSDTVFVEKLKIVEKEGHYYYVADVSHNDAPVYFKMTEVNASGFVCENPEHDFPKKISYRYDGEVLTATISAGSKEIPFRFRKKS